MSARKVLLPVCVCLLGVALSGCSLPAGILSPATSPPPTNPVVVASPTLLRVASPTPPASDTPVSSATPTITLTPSPTPTSTATPEVRVSSSAVYLSKAPKINGPWDEWTSTQYPIKDVVFGRSSWTGADDLQASYRVGWDAKYLYLAVKVLDDVYVQNAKGADLYKGDSIELLFSADPNASTSAAGLTATDFQIVISPGRPKVGENLEAHLYYPQAKAGTLTKVVIGAVSMPTGYRIEAAIPWSVLGISPAKGQEYGFAVSVSDNDNKDKNVQQTIVSNAPERDLADPTTWGLLTLK
jgi:hypothetical protein